MVKGSAIYDLSRSILSSLFLSLWMRDLAKRVFPEPLSPYTLIITAFSFPSSNILEISSKASSMQSSCPVIL